MERVLGTPARFATAYGNVGPSILGLTAVFALGRFAVTRAAWRPRSGPDDATSISIVPRLGDPQHPGSGAGSGRDPDHRRRPRLTTQLRARPRPASVRRHPHGRAPCDDGEMTIECPLVHAFRARGAERGTR
jgi:hypothetical protein